MKEKAEAFYWRGLVIMIDQIQKSDNRCEFAELENKLKEEAIKSYIHNWKNKYIEKERRKLFRECLKRGIKRT